MNFTICVVAKEYRYVEVEAESQEDAIDKAWNDIETIMNGKAVDYDTEMFVE